MALIKWYMKQKHVMRQRVSNKLKRNDNYGLLVDGKMVIKKIFEHIQIHPLQLWKKIHSSGGNLSIDKYSYFDLSNKIATIKPELLKINDDTRKRRAAYAKAKKKFGNSVSLPTRDEIDGK